MRRWNACTLLLVAGIVALFTAPAYADLQTDLYLTINGSQVSVPVTVTSTDSEGIAWLLAGAAQAEDYTLRTVGAGDSDPFISYGFVVANASRTPLAVSAHYSLTDLSGGPWDTAVASLSVSATGGPFGFAITTAAPGTLQTAAADSNFLAVGLGGDCSGGVFATVDCGMHEATLTFPLQSFSTLDLYVNFGFLGLGSTASVSGRVELLRTPVPVPEPALLAIEEAAGFGVVLLMLRRRRRA